MSTRINKYLSSHGVCSRREADRLIEAGRVLINNKRAVLGDTVSGDDLVIVDNKPVNPEVEKVYYAFHKPKGVEVTQNPNVKNNFLDAFPSREHVFPVGRLDKDSSGLLLVTNDGEIVNKILRPEFAHEKEYIVHTRQDVTPGFIDRMAAGVKVDGRLTQAAEVTYQNKNAFRIVLKEGRNRQIRKMAAELKHDVTALKRVRIMNIKLGHLKPGQARPLSNKEKRQLFRQLV